MNLTSLSTLLVALALVIAIAESTLLVPILLIAAAAVNEFLAFWALREEEAGD